MEVNEKCDVYSFGVLTLEVIMGNHPGDLVSFLSSSSLSSATTSTAHDIQLKDILDQHLKSPRNQAAFKVVLIAKLALACLATNLGQPCKRFPRSYLLKKHLHWRWSTCLPSIYD